MREIDHKKMKHTMRCLKNALFLTGRVTAVCGKQTEIGTVVFRTAIEAEILYQALYVLSTTLEHKFDEMSNLCTDRMSGGVEQRRVFPLKNS